MTKTTLERAKKAFYKKKYEQVISLLEGEILQYRDSFNYYYMLGLACLHTGDIGGATSYFQRARQIRIRDTELLAAQAALFLRKGESHQAVEYYLEILEYAPSHTLAKKALHFLRKKADEETIASLNETGKIAKFYPELHGKKPTPLPFILSCLLIAGIAMSFFVISMVNQPGASLRADLQSFQLSSLEKSDATESGGLYRYVLTTQQILTAYADAQKAFLSYNDNIAQREINRILLSNASVGIKQKARLLMTYVSEPKFDTISERFTYSEIMKDPQLYQDCWIVWKGMATNIQSSDYLISFDFLVGYDTRNRLEGILPVQTKVLTSIQGEKPLELLAKVQLDGNSVYLVATGIYQAGQPVTPDTVLK